MTNRTKIALAAVAGILVIAVGSYFLLGNREGGTGGLKIPFTEPATCPLSGIEPKNEELLDRPAVAVKIENASLAYPLSGLDDAEIVYEELVEGGLTRFMAIYHCTDSDQVGPVRSSRAIDPAIMSPITHILVAAGGNDIVRKALDEAEIFIVDENTAGEAMSRVPREGLGFEHTLYADTKAVRKVGKKEWDEPPTDEIFTFGELEGKAKKAAAVNLSFSAAGTVRYEWTDDGWARFDGDNPHMTDGGEQIVVDNVLIEEHDINYSRVSDVLGAKSIEIADETGSGRAVLFRDGMAIKGKWERESVDDPVSFVTKEGDTMVFAPGTIWVELLPSDAGEVKGSFSIDKK